MRRMRWRDFRKRGLLCNKNGPLVWTHCGIQHGRHVGQKLQQLPFSILPWIRISVRHQNGNLRTCSCWFFYPTHESKDCDTAAARFAARHLLVAATQPPKHTHARISTPAPTTKVTVIIAVLVDNITEQDPDPDPDSDPDPEAGTALESFEAYAVVSASCITRPRAGTHCSVNPLPIDTALNGGPFPKTLAAGMSNPQI